MTFFALPLCTPSRRDAAQQSRGGGWGGAKLLSWREREGQAHECKSTICSSLTLRASLKITGTGCAIFSLRDQPRKYGGVLAPKKPLGFLPLGFAPATQKRCARLVSRLGLQPPPFDVLFLSTAQNRSPTDGSLGYVR